MIYGPCFEKDQKTDGWIIYTECTHTRRLVEQRKRYSYFSKFNIKFVLED
ncbi:hypothetical protein HanIR_Chr15g0751531 [Helianthus annuus]|nr:hypothetical protein HanIR_Chr15g0751531 [Helianthus annuus]